LVWRWQIQFQMRQKQASKITKKARRATYSLMSTGLHGNNGLDPETSLQLIKTYNTPILLYGLELILPNKTLTTKLERFQKKNSWNKFHHCHRIHQTVLFIYWQDSYQSSSNCTKKV
jgi:hypothetical protein